MFAFNVWVAGGVHSSRQGRQALEQGGEYCRGAIEMVYVKFVGQTGA